jgi:hypothetical protein
MKTMKRLLSKCLLGVILMLSACTGAPQVVPTDLPPSIVPSSTQLGNYSSIVTTPSPNGLKSAYFTERCPVEKSLSDSVPGKFDGQIVLLEHPTDLSIVNKASLLDLRTGQSIDILHEGEILSTNSIAVSPERKLLAYGIETQDDKSIKLIVSTNKGDRQISTPIKSSLPYPLAGNVGQWLTNEQLYVDGEIVNPFNGSQNSFNADEFPDFAKFPRSNSLVFSPKLNKVVYRLSNANIGLVDVSTREILATFPEKFDRGPEVAWLPDGTHVAIIGAGKHVEPSKVSSEEIFIVDESGRQIRQVTHLSTFYQANYNLFNPVWSPDGRYIAFWQKDVNKPTKGLRLLVVDTQTEQTTSYCTWGEPKGTRFYGPIWSPNGKQLLIGDQRVQDTISAVIVDVDTNNAFLVSNDAIPGGWMN